MKGVLGEQARVEVLGAQHDRASFRSGVEPLDRYLRTQAGQDFRKNMAAPFVLALGDGSIAGYYTLSATALSFADLPSETSRKLPRYPLVPATLLGRLAVDLRHRSKGLGRYLLADALFRAMRSEIASFAVIVDAKDETARAFYERESFLPLPDQRMKLFLPMADIEQLFKVTAVSLPSAQADRTAISRQASTLGGPAQTDRWTVSPIA